MGICKLFNLALVITRNKPDMNINNLLILVLLATFCMVACKNENTSLAEVEPSSSKTIIEDPKAAKLVDNMMTAMGGNEKWEELSYISWTFFGARHLIWDKKHNRVRIESPRDSSIYLVNLNDLSGKYAYDGVEVTDMQKLNAKLKRGKNMWINDMYWLFMPFKLTDPGVNVKYIRNDTTLTGLEADILELRFDNVGNSPNNKYQIYIDKQDQLIKQWNFYAEASQDTVSKIWPWDNYKSYNGLQLSAERSDKSGPSNVRVYDDLEDEVFTSFEPFEFY